jgi:polyribonucleotide nucleotidyltransferase
MIKQIQEDTGADIAIEDDGTVYIGAVDGPSAEAARNAVNAIANPTMPEVGERFLGTVVKTTTFGAFVSLTPGKDGLLHISEIRKLVGGKRIDAVEDVLSVGQKVQVELKEVDPRGKLSLGAVVADEVDAAAAEPVSAPIVETVPEVEAPVDEAAVEVVVVADELTSDVDDEDVPAASGSSDDGPAGEDGNHSRPRRNRRRRGGRNRGGSGGSSEAGVSAGENQG